MGPKNLFLLILASPSLAVARPWPKATDSVDRPNAETIIANSVGINMGIYGQSLDFTSAWLCF